MEPTNLYKVKIPWYQKYCAFCAVEYRKEMLIKKLIYLSTEQDNIDIFQIMTTKYH